ncbi:MAG: rubrerythrin family protein [Burkholderiaceae bacterium]|nr:rubrerythrin family protein [Burkholderiaceae bacterium]
MREPPFEHSPDAHPKTLAELVGIANAIEQESVRRYAALAEGMALRGEAATAAALRVMLDEERKHVNAVADWAASIGEALPGADKFRRSVPADLWKAWDEAAGSARLTPYRAFAIAAASEQKAFALYSYIAADAADPRIRAQAEQLALEELRHASLMRRFRRQAWHRERRDAERTPPTVASADALHALLGRHEAEIEARHRAIAARLRTLGADADAALLERLLRSPSWPPDAHSPYAVREAPDGDAVALLVTAQEALEAFSETLEGVLRTTEGDLFTETERALASVVTRIAQLALHTADRLQQAQALQASR